MSVTAYEVLREEIDAALGDGLGLDPKVAVARLSPAAHTVWVLDNLLADLFDFRLHLWDQTFADRGYDGVRVVSAIAEQQREVDPLVADLLRWTMRWKSSVGIALSSLPPELWVLHARAARHFLLTVAEKWPREVAPDALPMPAPWARVALPGPVRVSFPPEHRNRSGVFRVALDALWRQGAPDEALQRFFEDYFARGEQEVEVLRRFVSFDESDDAMRALIHPPDALALFLGLERLVFPALVRVATLDEVRPHLTQVHAVLVQGDDVSAGLRSALRQDPDVLLLDAGRLGAADLELLSAALDTGHLIIAAGDSQTLDGFSPREGVPVVERRAPGP